MHYIFVDESRITKGRYQLLWSLWLPREKREQFCAQFWSLWSQEFPTRRSELKWTKVSLGRLRTYKKFVDFFATFPYADFRCVVLDTHSIDYQTYHAGDKKLGFYKFFYFFINRNIEKDYTYRGVQSHYQIFIDRRRKGDSIEVGRLLDLKNVLNNRLDDSCVKISQPVVRNIEATDSKQSPEIQIVDVLLGMVGYAWDGFQTSASKCDLIAYTEELFGLSLKKSTPYLADKINIWQFKLQNKQKKRPST